MSAVAKAMPQVGAGELFAFMDATLSAIKQMNVEIGDQLRVLALARRDAGGQNFQDLEPPVADATIGVFCSVIEQLVDASTFFLLIWGALRTGNVLLAGGVRLLVSLNTWNSRRQKHLSPWRLADDASGRAMEESISQRLGVLLRGRPGLLLVLGNLFAQYAVRAGFLA